MTSTDSLRIRSITAVAWSALQGWGSQVIGLIVFSLLAKILDPIDFGIIAMAVVFIAATTLITDFGLAVALIQREKIEPQHQDTAFWFSVFSSIVLFTLSQLLAPWIAALYSQPELIPILRILSFVILFRGGAAVQIALMQRSLNHKSLALRNFISLAVSGTVGVGLALAGFGVWSLVGQQLSHAVVLCLTLWWICPWKPKFRFSIRHLYDILNFALFTTGVNIATFINNQADKFIIGVFLGPTVLGYYAIAHRLLEIMLSLLSGVITQVALPVFSSLQSNIGRLREAFMTALRLGAFVAYPCLLGLATLAPILLPTLFDPKWESSVLVVQILCISGVLFSTLYFHANLMMSLGKQHWRLALTTCTAMVKTLIFLLVVEHGIVAIAIAGVASAYLFAPVSIFLVDRLLDLNFRKYFYTIAQPLCAALIMMGCIRITSGSLHLYVSEPVGLLASIGLGIIVYGIAIRIIAPKTTREMIRTAQSLVR